MMKKVNQKSNLFRRRELKKMNSGCIKRKESTNDQKKQKQTRIQKGEKKRGRMADAKTLLAGDVIRVTFSVMNLKNDRMKRKKNNKKKRK